MGILKLGKRIGKDFDLNINVNRRDVSEFLSGMTADAGDIRLERHLGPNDGGIMGQFLSHVAQGEGLARKSRYYASFNLPRGYTSEVAQFNKETYGWDVGAQQKLIADLGQKGKTKADLDLEGSGFANSGDLENYQTKHGRRVNAFCRSINIPEREIKTESIRHGADAPRHFVYDHGYGELTAKFYADRYMRERTYFELWQKTAFNNASNNYNFHDNYVADMDLFLIGQFNPNNLNLVNDVSNDRADVVYGVKLYDVFPTKIAQVDLSYDKSDIIEFEVTFSYHKWLNYFINDVGGVELHDGKWRQHRQMGEFPFLDWLPKPLRRTGRDALENLRRRLPLGKLFKGRLFPF